MRIVKTTAFIVSMLGFSGIALAQQCKIALVNIQQVVTASNEGNAARPKFDARVAQWQARIDVLQREYLALDQKQKGQNGNRNKAEITDMLKALLLKQEEIDITKANAQVDVDSYRDSILAPITKSAFEIAKQVAAEKGIDSVVDSSSPTTTVPVNANANCDLTSEVKTRMNAKLSTADPAK